MAIFKLRRDEKYASWWRDYYEIKADTLEEAIKIINNGDVEPYDTESLPDCFQEPLETEILDEEGNVVYDSKQF